MTQMTIQADAAPSGNFRFWHCIVTAPYFIALAMLFSELMWMVLPTSIRQNHDTLELIASTALALVCAMAIGSFIASAAQRKSQRQLSLTGQVLYYVTVGLGWFGILAMPLSLIAGVMLFSSAKFTPDHHPASANPPSIESR